MKGMEASRLIQGDLLGEGPLLQLEALGKRRWPQSWQSSHKDEVERALKQDEEEVQRPRDGSGRMLQKKVSEAGAVGTGKGRLRLPEGSKVEPLGRLTHSCLGKSCTVSLLLHTEINTQRDPLHCSPWVCSQPFPGMTEHLGAATWLL